jgi:hypothetical protein
MPWQLSPLGSLPFSEAVQAPASAGGARIVSLHHLLALKCHAIKHGHTGRIVKDGDDVIHLVQANRLDPNEPALRELFLKHGTQLRNSMKKSVESVTKTESGELDLPEWSAMGDFTARVSTEFEFELCERYRSWFPESVEIWQSQRPGKCAIEFVL